MRWLDANWKDDDSQEGGRPYGVGLGACVRFGVRLGRVSDLVGACVRFRKFEVIRAYCFHSLGADENT